MFRKKCSIKKEIERLEKQREGMSHGSVDYPRITKDIEVQIKKLAAEPHWTAVPGFFITVISAIAACAAAYFAYVQLQTSNSANSNIPVVTGKVQQQPQSPANQK